VAVYKRTYTNYSGSFTDPRTRFLVLPRYSYERLFQSRFLTGFLVACLFFPVGCIGYIYLVNNLSVFSNLGLPVPKFLSINGDFFLFFMSWQGAMAYILTALIGPNLIAPDLANNALPTYFSRPFSRAEYVVGKISVLFILLSLITWLPGTALFLVQSSQAGWDWVANNWYILRAIILGFGAWILLLSLISVAMSAWVKWKVVAGALILGIFAIGAGLAGIINSILRTEMGSIVDLSRIMYTIWGDQFGIETASGIEPFEAWLGFFAVSVVCLLMLERKIRPKEIVR
jgi:ABC-2 type transport system permease protein